MQYGWYNCKMSRAPIAEKEIINLLEKFHLLSAMELLEKMTARRKQVNKTTVYRSLEKLLTKGHICRHSLGSDTLYYELRSDHHDHAVCESCGETSPIACQEKIEKSRLAKGFTPLHHHLTVFGLCKKCSLSSHTT